MRAAFPPHSSYPSPLQLRLESTPSAWWYAYLHLEDRCLPPSLDFKLPKLSAASDALLVSHLVLVFDLRRSTRKTMSKLVKVNDTAIVKIASPAKRLPPQPNRMPGPNTLAASTLHTQL